MKPRVELRIKGYNLDQLINKLQSNNIVCYGLQRIDVNQMVFCVSFKDYIKAKSLCKNYEVKFKFLGLANFKSVLIKNLAIILIFPIMIGLIIFSTKFTWNIKIYGGEKELHQQIEEILKDNNIAVGKVLPSDAQQIEQILIKQLPNIAQVSCIKRGTSLIINISKKLVYAESSFEPICASVDGIITSFSLISGTIAVNVGDFVSRGDILVYPFTLDKNGKQVSVKPIAEIKAKAYIVGATKLEASRVELVRTGNTYTTSSIKLLNRNLFSKKFLKPFDIYETSVYNEYISSVLPVIKTTTTYYELAQTIVNYDLEQEKSSQEIASKQLAYNNLPTNSEILDSQTTSLIVDDNLYCTTTLTIVTIIS